MGHFNWFHFLTIFYLFSVSISTNFLDETKKPEIFDWMVKIRRKIHENPELGYEEFETSELIRAELDKLGIPYRHDTVAVTAVIGFIGTGTSPFVALRADMDALALQGTVVLVFQPAEEGGGGAKKIVEAGALENVTAIFGLHITARFPIGEVASTPGLMYARSGFFEATISGKGGHAAFPQHSIDPILAACNVVVSLQHLVSREADPLDSQVVSIGSFQGGSAFNVIPDSVTIGGTFRAFSKESFMLLRLRIEQVITGQAAVHRCNSTVNFFDEEKPFFPATVNNGELHKHFLNVAGNFLGIDKVNDILRPSMGAEDFSFYQEVIPGYYFLLGMQDASQERLASGHSPYYKVNEDALPYGAALHASLAASYLLKLQQGETVVEG